MNTAVHKNGRWAWRSQILGLINSWHDGLQDINGHAKPLRQDLPMGSRSLILSCRTGRITVTDQVTLLSSLYKGCALPTNWFYKLI